MSNHKRIIDAFLAGLELEPDLLVSEWADRYRVLPNDVAEPGPWRTDRFPFLRRPMDVMSPNHPCETAAILKPTQIGGTEIILNVIGYYSHQAPCPIMMVQPTDGDAEGISKERIDPMIEITPELAALYSENKEKDSKNTILFKRFIGGYLAMVGANAPTKLRRRAIRVLIGDELSAWKKSSGKEGDPLELARKRQGTFIRKKTLLVSTPLRKEDCAITREYDKGDQQRYFVPCPHCNFMQELKWGGPNEKFGIKWKDNEPRTAHYMCIMCGQLIEERHKGQMIKDGPAGGVAEWRPTAPGDGGKTLSFGLNALYCPPGMTTWADIAQKFLEARRLRDSELLQVVVNTMFAEAYEDEYSAKVGADALEQRCEFYKAGTAPAGVLVALMSVDVQDNRFGISVYGYGRDEEAWVISRQEVHGDPARPELWAQLDDIFNTPIQHEIYGEIKIWGMAIDTGGHFTHEVYQYARRRRGKVYAVKGQSQKHKPAIGKPTRQDINYKNETVKRGVDLYPVGTDTVKAVIYSRLKITTAGPGFYHFHNELGPDFFAQLTSEKQITKWSNGRAHTEWVKKKSDRNEALDEAVYNYALLQLFRTRYNRNTVWEQLENSLKKALEEANALKEGKPLLNETPTPTMNSMRKGFVKNW